MENQHDIVEETRPLKAEAAPQDDTARAQAGAAGASASDETSYTRAAEDAGIHEPDAEEEKPRREWKVPPVMDWVHAAKREARSGLLAILPPEVTQHLVNSRKELMQAGLKMREASLEKRRRTVAQKMEDLDRTAEEARELHDRLRAGVGAASEAKQEA